MLGGRGGRPGGGARALFEYVISADFLDCEGRGGEGGSDTVEPMGYRIGGEP